uniref:Growth hormone-inducible transmembrane protein n=1 Tax=Plectus sambesii TaxID=2011161 RepID=A0A914XC84_9BILA
MLSTLCQRGKVVLRVSMVVQPLRSSLTTSAPKAARGGFQERLTRQGINLQRTGPTLRERLLGPTTGKPFIYGTYALMGASAAGIGMLCYYGLSMSNEVGARERIALWPQYVHDRIKATYGYLGGSLIVSASAAAAIARSPQLLRLISNGGIGTMVVTIAAMIGTGALCRSIDYESSAMKHAAWALHCATIGAVVAPLFLLGGPVLMRAAVYTLGIVGGLSATAICAPSEKFLMWSGPLSMGLGVVFVSSIGTFFLPPGSALGAGLASIVVYGGLILFSAFLLYDTQRVIKLAETYPVSNAYMPVKQYDPINAQMGIYMDVINIFMRIAMIMGGNQRRK